MFVDWSWFVVGQRQALRFIGKNLQLLPKRSYGFRRAGESVLIRLPLPRKFPAKIDTVFRLRRDENYLHTMIEFLIVAPCGEEVCCQA